MNAMAVMALAVQVAAGWPWVGDADPQAHALRPGVPSVIRATWDGRPATVRIATVTVPNCHALGWLYGVAPDRQDRCTRLGSIDVSVAGRRLAITSMRYADLGGIKDVVVRSAAHRLTLYMRGPDGPEYYGATLILDDHDIIRRQIDLGDGGSETTAYSADGDQAAAN